MIDKSILANYPIEKERLHAALPLLAPAIATAIGAALGLTGTGLVLQKKIQNYFASNPGALDSITSKFGTKPGDQPEVEEELKELTKPVGGKIETWEGSYADTGTKVPEKLPEPKGIEVPPQEKVALPGFQKAEPLGTDILTKDIADETVPKEAESKKELKTNQLSEKELLFLKDLRIFGFPERASNTLDQKLKNLSEGKKAKLTKKEANDLSSYSLRHFEGQQGTDEAIFNSTDDLELLDQKLRRIYPEKESEDKIKNKITTWEDHFPTIEEATKAAKDVGGTLREFEEGVLHKKITFRQHNYGFDIYFDKKLVGGLNDVDPYKEDPNRKGNQKSYNLNYINEEGHDEDAFTTINGQKYAKEKAKELIVRDLLRETEESTDPLYPTSLSLRDVFQNLEYNKKGEPKDVAKSIEETLKELKEYKEKKAHGGLIDRPLIGGSRYI